MNIPTEPIAGSKSNHVMLANGIDKVENHTYDFRMWLNKESTLMWEDAFVTEQTINAKITIIGVARDNK